MYPNPFSVLDDWAWQCPCGARAQHRYSLCSKCQARTAWWRRHKRSRHLTRTRRVRRFEVEAVSE
jgi:hypothetical protein